MSSLFNTLHDQNAQGVIETKFGYVINGHYYDKGLNYYENHKACYGFGSNGNTLPKLDIAHVTQLTTNYGRINLTDNDMNIIEDEYIPNRFYIITDKVPTKTDNSITIIEEKDGDIKILCILQPAYGCNITYLGQTKDKLFIGAHIIKIINKHTFGVEYIQNLGGGWNHYRKIYQDGNYIYFTIFNHDINNFNLYRLNTTTHELPGKTLNASVFTKKYSESISDNTKFQSGNCMTYTGAFCCENFYFKDNICHIYSPLNLSPTKLTIPDGYREIPEYYTQMCHLTLDFNNEDWNTLNYEYHDTSVIGIKELMQPTINGQCIIHRTWIMENKYLCYITYNENIGSAWINYQNLHMFEIQDDCDLKYLYSEPMSRNNQVNTIVFNSDRSWIIIGYSKAFSLLKYDFENHKYIHTHIYVDGITTVGFDELDRLWYITEQDTETHVQNLTDPYDVTIKFEKDNYIYEKNKEIETYIEFESLRFDGEYASGRYDFVISGDAYFTSNSSKILHYNYTEQTKIKIPINIININGIQCSVTYIGELEG